MKIDYPYVTDRKNKDGTVRYYFRRRGEPLATLPGRPGSDEFEAEYERLKARKPVTPENGEGTFGWLCDRYMDSTDFTTKSDATRAARRRIIVSMMAERLDPGKPTTFAMERANKIGPKHVAVLRDRKAKGPNAANERLKVLNQIFKFAVAREVRTDNPVRDVRRLAIPRGGHETATDADIAAYEAFHRSGPARDALVLLKAFGMRVSDLRVLGPQHVQSGLLVFETVKTGVLCELTINDEARAVIARCRNLVFLRTEAGSAFASDKALSQRIGKWFRQAGVEDVTAHSVRKWLATKMAEDGSSENELSAWFGWRDAKESRPYVQAANRRKMARAAGERRQSAT